MPGAGRTHGPPATKKQAASPQVQPRHPGIPCAMVLRLIRDLLGAPGLFATVIRAMREASRELDTSVGVSGPHDFAVRHIVGRLAQARPTKRRPPHPRLACRDDRDTPLNIEAGWRS
jgi:hypothetical protein